MSEYATPRYPGTGVETNSLGRAPSTQPDSRFIPASGYATDSPDELKPTIAAPTLAHALRSWVDNGYIPKPNADRTLYVVLVDSDWDVSLVQGSPQHPTIGHACRILKNGVADQSPYDFVAYHAWNFELDAAYIVIPMCAADAPDAGPGDFGWFLTHELAEAIVDPQPNTGWYDLDAGILGGIADLCQRPGYRSVGRTDGHTVAAFWSNAAHRCIPVRPLRRQINR
jgi:hypothetical protein